MSATPTTRDTATFAGQITDHRWKLAARLLCMAVAAFSLIAFFLNYAVIYNFAQHLPDATRAALADWGLSKDSYFWIYAIGSTLAYVPFWVVGVLIYWRRPDERIAILSALVLLGFGAANLPTVVVYGLKYISTDDPLTRLTMIVLYLVIPFAWPLIAAFLTLFPDGRFVPAWMRYVAVIGVFISLIWNSFPQEMANPQGLLIPFTFLTPIILFGSTLYAQVFRYRKFSTPIQRQQTKWFVTGLAVIGFLTLIQLPIYFSPELLHPQPGTTTLVYEALSLLWSICFTALPLAIGFAILRYRLWDADLVMNRSMVYGLVTVILGAIFVVSVLILRAIVGQEQSGVVFAVALVAAGGLFNPTRKQVQNVIDRRLYRLRFNLNQLAEAQKPPEVKNPGVLTGRTLGKYQILDMLGKGGMGEVYKGFGGENTAALKILPDDLAQEQEYRTRFEREAETMRTLQHPNIVRLLDAAESDGLRFLALEFIDGVDLGHYLKEHTTVSPEEACTFIRQLAAALDYAHAKGLVHRDIKPSNIMLRPIADAGAYEAVLMDFGIAKIQDARTRYTGSGAIGTVDYMAPEQIMAAKEVDHRADIYALSVVLYEMLTGQRPFQGSAGQVLFAHLQQPPPDVRDTNGEIPRTIAHAVTQALAKDPQDRFESAGAFAQALN